MKIHFIGSVVLLTTATATFAQTEKGRGLITGNVAFSTNQQVFSDGRSTQNAISLNVGRGWFVQDNWLVGVGLGAGTSWSTYPGLSTFPPGGSPITDFSISSYGRNLNLSGFVRRYFTVGKFRPYLGVGAGGSYNRTRFESVVSNGTDQRFSRNFRDQYNYNFFSQLGVLYALTDRIGVELGTSSNGFPFNVNNFNIGLNILTGGPRQTPDVATDAPQTRRGGILLGGSLGFNGSTSDTRQGDGRPGNTRDVLDNTFSFGPSVAFFVNDGLLLGLEVPFSTSVNDPTGFPLRRVSATSLGVTPFVRKYIGPNRLRPFVQTDLSFRQQWTRTEGRNDISKGQQYGAGVSAGLAYMLGERFIVQATLGSLRFERLGGLDQSNVPWTFNARGTTSPTFSLNYVLR